MTCGVVIIGAGHAGGSCAAFLRQYGYEAPICLIGAESYAPYQRPPLSKAWLKGEASGDDLALRDDNFYRDQNIALMTDTAVEAIRPKEKKIIISGGREVNYDDLIIATGSKPRQLHTLDTATMPFLGMPHKDATFPALPYYALRNLDDAESLKNRLTPRQTIGIVGAGYVGLEVAASAIKLGCKVTVFEREDHILARVASQPLSDFLSGCHERMGVDIRCQAHISNIERQANGETLIQLKNGQDFEFDTVLVGIGALPADDLAKMAQIDCSNGIVVDSQAKTSIPHIYAIGDVTSRTLPFYEGRFRLESVPNALEQAKQAAAAITGYKAPIIDVPWFWSDQYDYKLQIAGLNLGTNQAVVRGNPYIGAFSVLHLDSENRLKCAECINSAADFMAAKQLIAKAVVLDPAQISQAEMPLKSLIPR